MKPFSNGHNCYWFACWTSMYGTFYFFQTILVFVADFKSIHSKIQGGRANTIYANTFSKMFHWWQYSDYNIIHFYLLQRKNVHYIWLQPLCWQGGANNKNAIRSCWFALLQYVATKNTGCICHNNDDCCVCFNIWPPSFCLYICWLNCWSLSFSSYNIFANQTNHRRRNCLQCAILLTRVYIFCNDSILIVFVFVSSMLLIFNLPCT